MTSTRKSITSGIIYTAFSNYSGVIISILITAVLARLLTPKEFGIIAIMMVFISFFRLLSDFGIGPAIIRNQNLTKDDIKSIFSFSILFGFILAALFYLMAPIISRFYNEPSLINIGKLLSLAILFFSFNVVPQSLNFKKLLFKQVGIISVVVQIITGSIAIFFAFKGFSYYALVIKAICDGLFVFIGNYILSPVAFSWKIKRRSISKIAKFSSFQFLFNFINYFSRNADNLLIGKYFGTAPLGYYDKAYKLMMLPISNLTYVITPVLLPVLSEFQDDKKRIYNAYIKVIKLLATIGFPLSIFLYFAAPEIVIIMFGHQWIESIPVFKILALTVGIQIILSSSGPIFQSVNRTDLLFFSGFLSAIMMVGGIVYGVFFGKNLVSVGHGLMVGFVVNFFQGFYMLINRGLKSSFFYFLKIFIFPIILSLGVFVALYLTSLIDIDTNITDVYYLIVIKILVSTFIFLLIFISSKENRQLLKRNLEKYIHCSQRKL